MMMKFFLPRSFFEKPSHFFFVYARAFESNERSRRRFDAIAQRKSAGFVRLLHRFSMDGWMDLMDAILSVLSFFLSLSLSLPLSLRANFISLTLSLSFSSFLPPKQTKTSFENNKIQSKSLARRKSPRRRRSSRSLTTKKKGRTMTRTRRPRPVVVASNPG